MILRYLPIIGEAPLAFVILVGAFVVSLMAGLIFHEFCHAYVADRLGDRTPRYLGRLTLNPKAHYDPVGTSLIFLVGFGWAKPVPVNPANTRNPKQAMTAIALAGPASNLVFAGLAGIPIKLGLVPFHHPFASAAEASTWTSPQELAGLFLGTILLLNVLLGVFNMLPIPPLDGSRVLAGLLPRELSEAYARLEPWGFGILMLLVLSSVITDGRFSLFMILGPFVEALLVLFAGDAGAIRFR